MSRKVNLRQIEAFKAVIESGTVSRAAQTLHISQPAMSKLIAHLEFDTGLALFDRVKGRLAPTDEGMRLYNEVERIFSGVQQVENAVEAIRRAEQGRLALGTLPALAQSVIPRLTSDFLKQQDGLYYSVQTMASQWIAEWLVSRRLDVGIVSARVDNPYLVLEKFLEQDLVCVAPIDHVIAAKNVVTPSDLDGLPFISFDTEIYVGHLVSRMLEKYSVKLKSNIMCNAAPLVCEYVAEGLGVALVHPLMASGHSERLVMRRFEPKMPYHFQICWSSEQRRSTLVERFVASILERGESLSGRLLAEFGMKSN